MARDRTARTRIRNYLVTHGPIDDPSGHATTVLKDAIDYDGSAVAFIQLIAAMDRDGELIRDIRGKRTYRITAAQNAEVLAGLPIFTAGGDGDLRGMVVRTDEGDIVVDYDKLARAVVRELLTANAGRSGVDTAAGDAELRAEYERMVAERNEYARRLDEARAKLGELFGMATSTEDASVTA